MIHVVNRRNLPPNVGVIHNASGTIQAYRGPDGKIIHYYAYIGRPSILGNPFPMKTEADREESVRLYTEWLPEQYKTNPAVQRRVLELGACAKNADLYLICWCAPALCHGNPLKDFIGSLLVPGVRAIIAGSRSFTDYNRVAEIIHNTIVQNNLNIIQIVSGTAPGIDKMGERYGAEHNIPIYRMPAAWSDITVPGAVIRSNKNGKYNVKAGYDRNVAMAEYADILIAIWDGESSGTAHMMKIAGLKKRQVYVYNAMLPR